MIKSIKSFFRLVVFALVAATVLVLSYRVIEHKNPDVSGIKELFSSFLAKEPEKDLGWELILVNADNPIPENYQVELTELANGQRVDTRIYPALQRMFDDMRADGVYPVVASGYRTAERQQQLMDEKKAELMASGSDETSAGEQAAALVAPVGCSEHQLGMAVDINADTERSTSDEVYQWLADNAYTYGFIQRYPPEKSELTGIDHEPWHYRYVGETAAAELRQRGDCLEEYISFLRENEG